jgi:hypothetical protein
VSGWVPKSGIYANHYCDMPVIGASPGNSMDWLCNCGKRWSIQGSQMLSFYGPTGSIHPLSIPVWAEVKPIPVPFTSTQAADAFLEGQ